ncbi:hypothetical protein [Wenzhouxiangella marina]|uniref:Uncharacterized protein n=1 Tax=Wenzhouxiangella marina TaxID=1579979 RepID=A0A0K0XZQ2_9GAMM|nr:hypothetical protein [Wenzhouxiangella marina]AKS43101.1 hypothetical protein WM2015_2744 [Wenzhouxiangella marina]MBB6087214.1 hypothetical protein [Wenzhouxiangella marina]
MSALNSALAIEKSGTGIERSGTGLGQGGGFRLQRRWSRNLLLGLTGLMASFQLAAAGPQALVSVDQNKVMVSLHVDGQIYTGQQHIEDGQNYLEMVLRTNSARPGPGAYGLLVHGTGGGESESGSDRGSTDRSCKDTSDRNSTCEYTDEVEVELVIDTDGTHLIAHRRIDGQRQEILAAFQASQAFPGSVR